jgi:HSP20 family protein
MNGLFDANSRTTQSWVPAVDVWETDREIVYAFDLPGIPESRISVELQDDALTVTGERELSEGRSEHGFHQLERRYGSFSRTLGVPQGIAEDSVKADYRHGVLEIRVAKPETKQPRRISIGGESAAAGNGVIDGQVAEA